MHPSSSILAARCSGVWPQASAALRSHVYLQQRRSHSNLSCCPECGSAEALWSFTRESYTTSST